MVDPLSRFIRPIKIRGETKAITVKACPHHVASIVVSRMVTNIKDPNRQHVVARRKNLLHMFLYQMPMFLNGDRWKNCIKPSVTSSRLLEGAKLASDLDRARIEAAEKDYDIEALETELESANETLSKTEEINNRNIEIVRNSMIGVPCPRAEPTVETSRKYELPETYTDHIDEVWKKYPSLRGFLRDQKMPINLCNMQHVMFGERLDMFDPAVKRAVGIGKFSHHLSKATMAVKHSGGLEYYQRKYTGEKCDQTLIELVHILEFYEEEHKSIIRHARKLGGHLEDKKEEEEKIVNPLSSFTKKRKSSGSSSFGSKISAEASDQKVNDAPAGSVMICAVVHKSGVKSFAWGVHLLGTGIYEFHAGPLNTDDITGPPHIFCTKDANDAVIAWAAERWPKKTRDKPLFTITHNKKIPNAVCISSKSDVMKDLYARTNRYLQAFRYLLKQRYKKKCWKEVRKSNGVFITPTAFARVNGGKVVAVSGGIERVLERVREVFPESPLFSNEALDGVTVVTEPIVLGYDRGDIDRIIETVSLTGRKKRKTK
jgi:hypothetical protein